MKEEVTKGKITLMFISLGITLLMALLVGTIAIAWANGYFYTEEYKYSEYRCVTVNHDNNGTPVSFIVERIQDEK